MGNSPAPCYTGQPAAKVAEEGKVPTKDEVKLQIEALPSATHGFWTKKEINHLPEILTPDERILGLNQGFLNGSTWLIVLTPRRVIFLDKGLLYGLKMVETPLEKINSIEHETGLFFGKIVIWDGASKMVIEQVQKTAVSPFVTALNLALDAVRRPVQQPLQVVAGQTDFVGQLQRLADMKTAGHITQVEFDQAKGRLLAGG